MTFDVRITIRGLCMLAPRRTNAEKVMHVLMPLMPEHRHQSAPAAGAVTDATHERHFVRLCYDRAYESATTTQPEDCVRCVALDGQYIRLDGPAPGDPSTDLDENRVVFLDGRVCFDRVSDACIGAEAGRRVASRLELRAGTGTLPLGKQFEITHACATSGPGSLRKQPMAHKLEWTVGPYDQSATVTLAELFALEELPHAPHKDPPDPALWNRPLHPKGNRIDLHLLYLIDSELPHDCKLKEPSGDFVRHFDAYYELAETRVPLEKRKKPVKVADGVPAAQEDESALGLMVGATCMLSAGRFTK